MFLCSLWFNKLILMFILGMVPIILITYAHFTRLELESALELMRLDFEYPSQVY